MYLLAGKFFRQLIINGQPLLDYQPHVSILREYDIRGTFLKTLNEKDAWWLGHTFGHRVRSQGGRSVVVGRDGRLSSPALEVALTNGLQEQGIDVIQIGLVPTPILYFAEYECSADAGIMITGSHNPPDQNGFKLTLNRKPFYGTDIQFLQEISISCPAHHKGRIQKKSIVDAYLERIRKGLTFSPSLSIAWDPGNGSTAEVVRKLTQFLPGKHFLINDEVDGTFPAHHPDPTNPENLIQLQGVVRRNKCTIGIAFDGDGDRLGIIDQDGHILWGDQLLLLFAKEILKKIPQALVLADVKTSQVVFDEVARWGGRPLMWKTGHSHIKSKMKETGAVLAGEMSGHFFFADQYYGFDDGIYAALRLIDILSTSQLTLKQFYNTIPQVASTPEIRFECEGERKFLIPQEIKKQLEHQGYKLFDVDGIRVQMDEGWWLLRASNTQDMLVARCESTTAEGLNKVKSHLSECLREQGLKAPFL